MSWQGSGFFGENVEKKPHDFECGAVIVYAAVGKVALGEGLSVESFTFSDCGDGVTDEPLLVVLVIALGPMAEEIIEQFFCGHDFKIWFQSTKLVRNIESNKYGKYNFKGKARPRDTSRNGSGGSRHISRREVQLREERVLAVRLRVGKEIHLLQQPRGTNDNRYQDSVINKISQS